MPRDRTVYRLARTAVALAALGLGGTRAEEVYVGANDRTGQKITLTVPAKHPVLPVAIQCPGWGPTLDPNAYWIREYRQKKGDEAIVESLRQDPAKVNVGTYLFHAQLVAASRSLPPQQYTECLLKAMDALVAAGKDGLEPRIMGAVENAPYAVLFRLLCRYGTPTPEQKAKYAAPFGEAARKILFPDGKLNLKATQGQANLALVDLAWEGLAEAERKLLEARYVSQCPGGFGCNNSGHMGWVRNVDVAAVFGRAEMMGYAIADLKHWLGHDLYPDGMPHDAPPYNYCHEGNPDLFRHVSQLVSGFDLNAFASPGLPDPVTSNRDGFEEPVSPEVRAARNIPWLNINSYRDWYPNRAAPDGSIFSRGDMNPDVTSRPFEIKRDFERPVPLLSANLHSIMVLRGGGPAEDFDQGLKGPPRGEEERSQMIYACLDGEATDACHNHLNMLQLLVWGKGYWLADDNGCTTGWLSGTYDRKLGIYGVKTYAHNTVTVDQTEQFASNSTRLFFGEQPGFRVAAMDAGYVYDGVYHQRTVALTDRYIVDLNLLAPRKGEEGQTHTFDYMLQGTGEFDLEACKFPATMTQGGKDLTGKEVLGHDAGAGMEGKPIQEYCRWPNIDWIYPYVRWYAPYITDRNWEVTWGLPRAARMRVLVLNGAPMGVGIGMAELNLRGPGRATFQAATSGVPKILARREGDCGRFLVVMEPHRLTSGIGLCERLDDQALRVTLTDGSADYVLLQREAPSYAFIRVKDGKVVAARILDGRELKVGEVTLLKTSQKVSAAGVEFRNGEALVAVSADAAVDLTVCGEGTADAVDKLRSGGIEPAVTAGQDSFKVSLTPGRTRLTVKGKTPLAGPQVALDALANLHRTIPPRPPAEADNLYRHRAKRLWQKQILWPRIYHDGAYRGQEDIVQDWAVKVTNDGKLVAGTHLKTVECYDKAGKKLWAYWAGGRCSTNRDYDPCYVPEPLHINRDGTRVIAGSENGFVHLLDGSDGRYVWRTEVPGAVNDLCPNSGWSRFAVACDKGFCVLDASGKKLVEAPTEKRVYLIRLADDGHFAVLNGDWRIAFHDPEGKKLWEKRSPGYGHFGGSPEMEAIAAASGKHFTCLDMTPDGQTLVAGSTNTYAYRFDGRSGELKWKAGPCDDIARTICVSDDGNTIAFGGKGSGVFCFDGSGTRLWKYLSTFDIFGVDMTPDGRRIAAASPQASAAWVLGRDKTVIARQPVHSVEYTVPALSPNGKYLGAGTLGYDLAMFELP